MRLDAVPTRVAARTLVGAMTASSVQQTPASTGTGPAVENVRRHQPAMAWALLGLLATVLITITGSRLADRRFHWWFRVVIDPEAAERALFYLGMVGLVIAWLGLARFAREGVLRPLSLAAVGTIWSVPLLVGPPLFSHDLYSYYAQGTIAHLGLSPYRHAPAVLGSLGYGHVLRPVDPFWRHTTAPYGPLFLGLVSLVAGLTGQHVFAGFVLVRLLDFLGLLLLAVFVPRLARRIGGDPTRATWIAVASPLILLQLVAPGHNDLLMVGLMVAGVALALDRRPLLGVVVCMIAATVKLPAAGAAVFIAIAWIRDQEGARARVEAAAKAVGAAILITAAVTLVTGFGLRWISTSLFSTPGRVHLAITPATDVSFTIAKLLGFAGAGVHFSDVKPVLQAVMFAVSALVGLVLLARTRWRTLTGCLGLTLVAFAVGGPALWPWYLAWGLGLLAASRPAQDSVIVVAVIVVGSFLVRPDGILLLSLGSSPVIAVLWLLALALALFMWRRRRPPWTRVHSAPSSGSQPSDGLGRARSALAEH